MIVWRRLTVITFHSVPSSTSRPNSTITIGHQAGGRRRAN